jgi:hypothetical protein
MDHQSQSLHYVQLYAALDRIDFSYLPNNEPLGDVSKLALSSFLPDVDDCSKLREHYAILIGRILVKKLSFFEIFADCTPQHIVHRYSEAMSKKSELVRSMIIYNSNQLNCSCMYVGMSIAANTYVLQ